MSTKPNHRRGHPRVSDGGPHGYERKRWAKERRGVKKYLRTRFRVRERDAVATGEPLPQRKNPIGRERFRA